MPSTPNLRPWLSELDGEWVLEPLPGISFDPGSSRAEVNNHLRELAAFGVCNLTIQQDGDSTVFTISANGEATMIVFDDDQDRIVALVPIRNHFGRMWN